MPKFETKWGFRDRVFLAIRRTRCEGEVCSIRLSPNCGVLYLVTWETGQESEHYEWQLTDEYEPRFDSADGD